MDILDSGMGGWLENEYLAMVCIQTLREVVLGCDSSAYLPHRSNGSTWTTRLLLVTKEPVVCSKQVRHRQQADIIHVGYDFTRNSSDGIVM